MDEDFNLICSHAGVRADTFIAESLAGELTRSEIQNLITEEKVMVNGKAVAKNYKTRLNDVIWVENAPKIDNTPKEKEIPLEIIYEDSGLLVINKPRGMVVHPGAGKETDTIVNALLFHCKNEVLSDFNGDLLPGIVHRI
ncbi:MAG: S4 domain-containing protein, partial [Oscillospiraceae bacterium]